MKKLLATVGILILGMVGIVRADWLDLKGQIFDQTKITIHESGGIAGFYDAAEGNSFALKEGVLSNVITNRFVAGSLGWFTANDQEGVLVGGPTLKVNELMIIAFPTTSELIRVFAPPIIKPLAIGLFLGWGTDSGRSHYGVHLTYNFGS